MGFDGLLPVVQWLVIVRLNQIEEVGRFVVECAQEYGSGDLEFYSTEEFSLLKRLYGDMSVLQTTPDR